MGLALHFCHYCHNFPIQHFHAGDGNQDMSRVFTTMPLNCNISHAELDKMGSYTNVWARAWHFWTKIKSWFLSLKTQLLILISIFVVKLQKTIFFLTSSWLINPFFDLKSINRTALVGADTVCCFGSQFLGLFSAIEASCVLIQQTLFAFYMFLFAAITKNAFGAELMVSLPTKLCIVCQQCTQYHQTYPSRISPFSFLSYFHMRGEFQMAVNDLLYC